MRLLKDWKMMVGAAIALTVASSFLEVLRVWAIGCGLVAACMYINKREDDAETRYREYVRRWAHEPFQSGWAARGISSEIRQSDKV